MYSNGKGIPYFILGILLAACLTPFSGIARARIVVPLAVHETTARGYQNFLNEKGVDPLEITDYSSLANSRPVIGLVLLQKALKLGGLNAEIKLIPTPNTGRSDKAIRSGQAAGYGSDMWESAAGKDFYVAGPIVEATDFIKLFYVKKSAGPERPPLSLDDLRRLTGIVVHTWRDDQKVLDKAGLRYITAPNWELMWRMLKHGRGDYVFLEPGCTYELHRRYGVTIVPVKGIKASFPENRSFLIYKRHPLAKRIYKALQKGLKILRQNGEIKKALAQCCVPPQAVKNWRDITIRTER